MKKLLLILIVCLLSLYSSNIYAQTVQGIGFINSTQFGDQVWLGISTTIPSGGDISLFIAQPGGLYGSYRWVLLNQWQINPPGVFSFYYQYNSLIPSRPYQFWIVARDTGGNIIADSGQVFIR